MPPVIALLVSVCALTSGARSSSASGPELAAELDAFNHAYAIYLGSGYYVVNGRSVFVLRIAPKIGLRSAERHAFGIRLRLNGTVGFYDFRPEDLVVPQDVNTFAFVPGVEFLVPVKPNWTLAPFLDFGLATDTAFEEVTTVLGTGVRSRAVFGLGRYELVLWNELIHASNESSDFQEVDDYTVFRSDLELRGLVTFRIGGRPYDFGLLVEGDRFLNSLVVFPAFLPLEIEKRWQLGFTVGPRERWRVFRNLVTVPRIGVGYSFGDGGSGVRVLFRTRY